MTSLSCFSPEIEQLFIQLELKQSRSICLTADMPQAGTTTIAMALCERYLLAGFRTLYVDMAHAVPCFQSCGLPIDLIQHKTEQKTFAGVTLAATPASQMRYRDPVALQTALAAWFKDYDKVIFDATFVANKEASHIPATMIASCCDATLLVAKASSSKAPRLQQALKLLKNSQCAFIGIALNGVSTTEPI